MPSSIRSTVRTRIGLSKLLRAMDREPTRDDVDALVGPATPHFAYQIRARVRELVAGFRTTATCAATPRHQIERLDRLGHASSKADEGPREAATRLGWNEIPSSARRRRPAAARVNVFVTGGSRGIGRAIALRFARDGAKRIAIGYLRNDSAAEETAEELRALGAEPTLVRGNVTSQRVLDEVAALGPLDVLVHNAATGVIRPALETEDKHWDWTMNANARALLQLARVAAPNMPDGSSIVALSSLGAQRVLENYVLVGTSKAALESLVRYLGVELAPRIRVNAVSGGVVETGALEHFPNREEMLRAGAANPVGRLVTPGRHRRRGRVPLLDGRRHDPRPDDHRRRRVLAARQRLRSARGAHAHGTRSSASSSLRSGSSSRSRCIRQTPARSTSTPSAGSCSSSA